MSVQNKSTEGNTLSKLIIVQDILIIGEYAVKINNRTGHINNTVVI